MDDGINGHGQEGLDAQLEVFRQSDSQRNDLLKQLVDDLHNLERTFREKCNDFENEVTSRRHWQNVASEAERRLQTVREQTESNQFALALIDGDGVIFHDHLLADAREGGSEAGHLLLDGIKKYLKESYGAGSQCSIMVHIYANFDGLSRKLASIGILNSPSDLYSFAKAFSCNQPLFSFVDVGAGKERADHKIKEMFRLFVHNMHCKYIIFGGCHDNGYLTFLESHKRDQNVIDRMTLLESTPAERGFYNLGFKRTQFPMVFKSDPLPERPYYDRSFQNPGQIYGNSPLNTTTNTFSSPPPELPPAAPPAKPAEAVKDPSPPALGATAQPPPPARVPSVPTPGIAPASSTYANVGANDSQPKQISIAPTKPTAPRKAIFLNASDERIDVRLQKADPQAAIALAHRIKEQKVCNNYHLLGYCANGKKCGYSHEPKLSPQQQHALRLKARERPCGASSDCRDFNCLSGHHCPRDEDCTSEFCYFSDNAHYVDRTLKKKQYEDGEVEIVH